jgi:hypothetical protein
MMPSQIIATVKTLSNNPTLRLGVIECLKNG